MSSPKKMTTTTQQALPNDLLLSCIARVSRLYYPTLSLVSKSFRSLVASQELYKTRFLLGHAESCLYVCLRFPPDPNPRWYTLCRIPDRLKKKNSSGNLLVPILIPSSPSSPPPQSHSSNHLVAVGSNIYKIGGDVPSSSKVSVLDCKSHTWNQAPSMRVERSSSSSTVSLLDGKIYVAGGCEDRNSVNWVEAFDPKTYTWSSVTSPSAAIRYGSVAEHRSLGLGGKFYIFGNYSDESGVVYNPKEGRWNPVPLFINMASELWYYSCCVIDNILFCWFHRHFYWYDYKVNLWKQVNGLEVLSKKLGKRLKTIENLVELFKHERWHCKIVDYGGKMVVFWDEECDGYQENRIWCAEIELERRDGDVIWGKVVWFDVVLTAQKSSCYFLNGNALSATV
ncbi:Kelch repeat type 1 [Arabidopsis thaliana x Arabidopsis arenosa]|uniref:Kelch repeat type 1 n=1 Tax=Arabidopsis thaliana x Arabidopsis arenosa TaxID=1240361 RepID=A0A8T2CGX0_9BRAS|nr:Kelch repeat type 1 [Arabidopsis thaliana x Arabidopsis arenosa]